MNITIEKKKIAIDKVCSSLWSQAHGLMFSKRKTAFFIFDKARRLTIHTWFMLYPIDLYFLDKNKDVIEVKRDMKPFRVYQSRCKAHYLLEVPSK